MMRIQLDPIDVKSAASNSVACLNLALTLFLTNGTKPVQSHVMSVSPARLLLTACIGTKPVFLHANTVWDADPTI